MVRALKELGIRTVAVGTCYGDDVNLRLKRFLADSGYEFGKEIDTKHSDGIFTACNALPTAEVLQPLEEDLGKPVVSANQATMWNGLRIAKVRAQVQGYGSLLMKI